MDTAPKTYKPSGRANFSDLWPYLIVLTMVACLAATIFAILLDQGWYALILVPLFPVVIQCLIVRQAVFDCHVRNPLIAFGLVSSTLSLVYFGSFHVDQYRRWDVDWYRVNLLPGYITFRMETDELEKHENKVFLPKPISPGKHERVVPFSPPRIQFTLNWCLHILDYCLIALVPGCVAWQAARRPYCEAAGMWHTEEQMLLTDPSAKKLRECLSSDTFDDWVKSDFQVGNPEFVHCVFKIWYCPRASIPRGHAPDFYVSIDSQRPMLISEKSLIPLSQVFPGLYEWSQISDEIEKTIVASVDVAICETVAGPHKEKCTHNSIVFLANGISLILFFTSFLMKLALLATVVYLIDRTFPGNRINIWVILPIVVLAIVYLYIVFRDGPGMSIDSRFDIFFFRRVLRNQIQNRQDSLFDTHVEGVLYGQHYPRRMWYENERVHKNLSERFLYVLDREKRTLLLEGDSTRWVIPFSSLQSYEVEYADFRLSPEGKGIPFAVLVLRYQSTSGLVELPITCEHGTSGRNGFERTEAFHQMLKSAICPSETFEVESI
jgi:hypothetical protein